MYRRTTNEAIEYSPNEIPPVSPCSTPHTYIHTSYIHAWNLIVETLNHSMARMAFMCHKNLYSLTCANSMHAQHLSMYAVDMLVIETVACVIQRTLYRVFNNDCTPPQKTSKTLAKPYLYNSSLNKVTLLCKFQTDVCCWISEITNY